MGSPTFNRLLARLHSDREQAAGECRRLHERLTRYFEWNGGEDPAALADQTLDRLEEGIAKSGEDGAIQHVTAFALGDARLLLKEDARKRKRDSDAGQAWNSLGQDPASEEKERMDAALGFCLSHLPAEQRRLIESYYVLGENKARSHEKLAMRYGITVNALRTRALRLRKELEAAVARYLEDK
jgi:DNA-directed RNA polymerase specialized sigma24 family protein